ncbi:MAG TPA: peptidoglycan DD-metalloendopeptidase family protein [Stellaceae bacterium]|nr:peptidoglycan DD-metalloendopeptidase family protein [Stellaceae bacterium]
MLTLISVSLDAEPVLPSRQPLPPGPGTYESAQSQPELQPRIFHVRRGDTLTTLLARAGVPSADAQEAVDTLRQVWNPRELQIDQEVTLDFGPAGLQAIRLAADLERTVKAARGGDGHFAPSAQRRPLMRVPRLATGTIRTSLYDAAMEAGIPPAVLTEMVRAFSYDVDFQRDIQPGDSFEVLYERVTDKSGRTIGTGDLIYTAMTLSGETLRLYRHQPEGAGGADFFNARGQSVRKALLKTPIDGARLTSGFGARLHPILGYTTMHRGVDFGAPSGTPIMAAGDGVIEKIGPAGGYGNYVLLRHTATYETAYGHMSRFAAGLHVGSHVRQGQVIGYVGATGRATGPHLHYEVHINEVQVNPLSIKMEPGRKLAGTDLAAFGAATEEIGRQLISLRRDIVVAAAGGSASR